MASSNEIRLVIADLDGTLLDPEKRITSEARQVVHDLESAGILFSIVSGRPPFGMRTQSDTLAISLPISGFNGGEIATPDFTTLTRLCLEPETCREIERFFVKKNLRYWIYRGSDWIVLDPNAPHALKEARNVAFSPSVVTSFDRFWNGVSKIVGISDDHDYLTRCAEEGQELFKGRAALAKSQPYYLDVTHPQATKEVFVRYLSKTHSIPQEQIATIGDMPSDLPMFQSSGLTIAMGNALDSVKAQAHQVTLSNDENGFAYAMKTFVLARKAA